MTITLDSFGDVELKPLKGITIDNKIDINFGMKIDEVKNILGMQTLFVYDNDFFIDADEEDEDTDFRLIFDDESGLKEIFFGGYFEYKIKIFDYIIEDLSCELITELCLFLKEKSKIEGQIGDLYSLHDENYFFENIGIGLFTYDNGPIVHEEGEEGDEYAYADEGNDGYIITGLSFFV
jgi:hypothetical protein